MPKGVVVVHAHVTCQSGCMGQLPDFLYVRCNVHPTDNQAVKESAYHGNGYSAAWLECLSVFVEWQQGHPDPDQQDLEQV